MSEGKHKKAPAGTLSRSKAAVRARSRRLSGNGGEIERKGKSGGEKRVEYPFGLHPVDYSSPPPIYASPPSPPPKPGLRRYMFPITTAIALGTTAYFYVNNKNDAYDYWEAMQTGGMLPGVEEDYDDDDDDDLEDED